MKRTIQLFATVLLVLAFASAALAENANQRVVGKKGIGYYSSEAPLGVRYWMNENMAFDFGVNLGLKTKQDDPASIDDPNTTSVVEGVEDETLMDWAFDLGLPYVLHSEENTIVYARPGITLVGTNVFDRSGLPAGSTSSTLSEKGYDMTFLGGVSLGGEFFLGTLGWPNLSFSGEVGLRVRMLLPAAESADNTFDVETAHNDVSVVDTGSIGIHIYF
jgi:hypothetical protein